MGEFGSLDGHFAMIVESLWSVFKKTLIFQIDVNDFIWVRGKLWITLGHFRVTFAYESDFGVTLGSVRHDFKHCMLPEEYHPYHFTVASL